MQVPAAPDAQADEASAVPSLVDLAVRSAAGCLWRGGTLCLALVPEPELGRRIYTHWALLCSSQAQQEAEEEQAQEQAQGQGRGRGRSQGPRPFAAPVPSPPAAPGAALGLPPPAVAHARLQRLQRESQALGLFAQTFWQPQRLALNLAGPCSDAALGRLALACSQLSHLQLAAPQLASLQWLLRLPGTCLASITCLSLRGAAGLAPAQLSVLRHLPALGALDIGECPLMDDSAAEHLAALPALQVLNISYTLCGDLVVEALTYRSRMEAWAAESQQPVPAEALPWHPCRITHWQCMGSRVTGGAMPNLAALPRLAFLDVRATAVGRAALAPLERRFKGLHLVQGGVLAESMRLAAQIVNGRAFVCACAEQATAAAATGGGHVGGTHGAWVQEGVQWLVSTAASLEQLQQRMWEAQQQEQQRQQQGVWGWQGHPQHYDNNPHWRAPAGLASARGMASRWQERQGLGARLGLRLHE